MVKTAPIAYNSNVRSDTMIPTFHVIIRPAEDVGGYWAVCDMPNGGCNTQGDTVKEVEKAMYELVADWLEHDFPEIEEYFISFEVIDSDVDLEEYDACTSDY